MKNQHQNLTGFTIKNTKGDYLGKIVEVIKDVNKSLPEFLIIGCKHLFGKGYRYFAIPAGSSLIKAALKGRLIINTDSNDLLKAPGFNVHKRPKFDSTMHSIFELYGYAPDKNRK